MPKVAIVGVGNVGATLAYALVWSGLVSEIVLIDMNRARAEGEAMDINHAVPFHRPARVRAGDYPDCAGADIVLVAAGAAQKPGETRLDLVQKNTAIFRQIIPRIAECNPEGIILVATNPVDVLTYVALKLSGYPPNRVIGSGTILDTARFRFLLGEYYGVDPRSVHAYIVGEHGDSEVPLWSLANIAGQRLVEFCAICGTSYDAPAMEHIFTQTRDAAYEIIQRKGATYYAIASGLVRIVEAILRDQNTVLSVSSLLTDYHGVSDVCLSVPTVVNRQGAARTLCLTVSEDEERAFRESARLMREVIAQLELSGTSS
ncbi:MAG: L-lactate dehydrogenase [Chloroflexi bacterium]|nr:L-lactate dehydrogenase [Chloroflexota bacterium]